MESHSPDHTEGIIKFKVKFKPTPPLPEKEVQDLNAWREMMHSLQLIGQDKRLPGYVGYGNISKRLPPFDSPPPDIRFLITGTQTGGIAHLTAEHYATILACYPEENHLEAEGPILPSSETLTHGSVYALAPDVRWVLHAHSPHIWQHAHRLGLPITHPNVPYGTAEMAQEVVRLFQETDVGRQRIFSMGGHEDGVVSFGATAEEAAAVMVRVLGRAVE